MSLTQNSIRGREDSDSTTCEVFFKNEVKSSRSSLYIVQVGAGHEPVTLLTVINHLRGHCKFDPDHHSLSFLWKDPNGPEERVYIWCQEHWETSLRYWGSSMRYYISSKPHGELPLSRTCEGLDGQDRIKRPCRRRILDGSESRDEPIKTEAKLEAHTPVSETTDGTALDVRPKSRLPSPQDRKRRHRGD
ncbi:hypothetical protein BJY04DRAFT_216482 [Aspergillus karnatakaensis]|uniref:uncharacterized protein n=1 Tax=Aspergillus karnatakaensis TaxID=1810916 RepID=UPI003CCD30EF